MPLWARLSIDQKDSTPLVRHPFDVLGNAVLDALMLVGKSLVGFGVIGEYRGIDRSIVGHEALEGRFVGRSHDLGADLVAGTILRPDYRHRPPYPRGPIRVAHPSIAFVDGQLERKPQKSRAGNYSPK